MTAFKTGERVTVEYLNGFLMDESKAVTGFKYKSDLSLAEAKRSTQSGTNGELSRARSVAGGISRETCMIGG